jgi:hypothetical protein
MATASEVPGQAGSLDPAFGKVPFEGWFSGGEQARIRWTAHLIPAQLSNHQRLESRVEIQVDGADLAQRRGRGRLMIFVQLADRDNTLYQSHGSIELEKLEEGIKAQNVTYTQSVFVTPGDYTASFALLDTATGDHSTKRERLHVQALKNDPFPEAWRKLPAVEFLSSVETPDSWYLPEVRGKLHLPLQTVHPARIGVLVNLTPSERLSGSHRVQDRNLGALIPALKAISQVDLQNAELDVSLLDLSRRRVVFQQKDVRDLDWSRLKGSLGETDPGTIDVKALSDRSHSAAFFVSEVARRVANPAQGASNTPRVLIVLTSPVAFEDGEDLQPIQVTGAPAGPVYYFRIHAALAPVRRPTPFNPNRRFGDGDFGPLRTNRPMRGGPIALVDQLEPTLKPLGPRLFDVTTPEQFRKALATVLAEISSL